MNGHEWLRDLLWRLSAEDGLADAIGPDELADWPEGAFDELIRLRVLRQHTAAGRIVCPDCDDGHVEDVEVAEDSHGVTHLVIRCPHSGRVEVAEAALKRWRLERRAFAMALAGMVGATGEPKRLEGGRSWSLGVVDASSGPYDVWLDCSPGGTPNTADGVVVLAAGPSARGDGVVQLRDLLAWNGAALSVDRDVFARALARRAPTAAADSGYAFRRDGDLWELAFAGSHFRMRDLKGLGYIAALLQHPGEPIPVSRFEAPMAVSGEATGDRSLSSGSSSAQPVIDAETLKAVAAKIADLDEHIAAARDSGDIERVGELLDERGRYEQYQQSSIGLAGRTRTFTTSDRRSASRVQRVVRTAIEAIGKHDQAMALHLDQSVTTGYELTYRPSTPLDWSM